jgi:hypothetical protein
MSLLPALYASAMYGCGVEMTDGRPGDDSPRHFSAPEPILIQVIDGAHHLGTDYFPLRTIIAKELLNDDAAIGEGLARPNRWLRKDGDVIHITLANASAVYDHVGETLNGDWYCELRI